MRIYMYKKKENVYISYLIYIQKKQEIVENG